MIDLVALKRAFSETYEARPRLFAAPGRVNLIGEHTDYNEGFVLPIAVDRVTVVAASRRRDRHVRVRSLDLEKEGSFDLDSKQPNIQTTWISYVEGVARVLLEQGVRVPGADLAISSDVPIGAGLSSSAALEVASGLAFLKLAETEIDLVKLALAAQKAEHVYTGPKVGIMDQLTAIFGRENQALLIDCRSLARTHIEVNLARTSIVVCNTNIKHKLASSAYNQRRAECERGVDILGQRLPGIKALRDVRLVDFREFEKLLPDPVRRRCRHVITENARTLQAAEFLREGKTAEFGELMYESHRSLRDDYEVSCRELDVMVDLALEHEGVAGARMTGGGFGGCTVNLVREDVVPDFQEFVARAYQSATGIPASIEVVKAADGARELSLLEGH
ncbi:MAG TPA: galactokinase [Pyrinomonadaceae bacterium]|nr:galactokinase [Pyrinomonadaceae bacterium]